MPAVGILQGVANVHDVIEAFRKAPSNAERGAKFEQLMVRYFELDPLLSKTYDRVWRWMDWPERTGADTGIDLVARNRESGEFTAIQCKFYEPSHTLAKKDIDSFFTASGKTPFTNRIIISTSDKWGVHAEETLADQQIPVERIGLAEIAESPVNWSIATEEDTLDIDLEVAPPKEPWDYQQAAIDDVMDGFEAHDRGKLIMACGTGKTFTSLKIAEEVVDRAGGSGRVLFLVPSIALLSQTLREWTSQCQLPITSFAVCSDRKVSKVVEDINPYDVPLPATTDATQLVQQMAAADGAAGMTVVFSTYQSLPVVAAAQKSGLADFDLVVCDEAHRTTGVTLAGSDESNFVRIHDDSYIKATKRLYMTATPRLFDEKVKAKAEEYSAEITSMDDEDKYGPEFHRLSFGEAVDQNLLTDYKVLVLTVDEEYIAGPLQEQVADDNNEINLDDATRIIGCWNGLAKRAGEDMHGNGFPPDSVPMKRAVAFLRDIQSSKDFSTAFESVINAYDDADEEILDCTVHHVDGSYNALERNKELTWLKAPVLEGECRILSNARCLSEGVDVPALDAVMFLNPRNSIVDVVQSVGRVMRKAEGKEYGYIILPVGVPSGMEPDKALADNKRFKVVWQVLNALRSHDDRFNAIVNSIELNKNDTAPGDKGGSKIMGGHIGPSGDGDEGIGSDDTSPTDTRDAGTTASDVWKQSVISLNEWRDAIYARIVKNVGTRAYWEDWAESVSSIVLSLQARLRATIDGSDVEVRQAFTGFVKALQDNLNDSVDEDDAISMLAQHLITKPIFDALFEDYSFAAHNPVSQVMQAMVDSLAGKGVESEMKDLEKFYDSVRVRASGVTSASGKQKVITELYERFFKLAFSKQAEALGIVYTPVEIVDFLLRAANDVLTEEFGHSLSDEDVHILDGFTGTGTFMVRLLQSGIIKPEDLARKYASELHANEIMLLAYYIAAVNIEATYHGIVGGDYKPFEGIVLTDTFQISEAGDKSDTSLLPKNNERIEAQLTTPIRVIVGNPPYSKGQASGNDNNANIKYPTLDSRIEATYARQSTGTNKNSLYDSYIRAIRWATDRIGDQGVVAFVTNGGWIRGNTADGIRRSLTEEYNALYVYNLRGNQRTAGEESRREGGKVFGGGSRNTVAMLIAVKSRDDSGPCKLYYRDIGDYLSREQKLSIVEQGDLSNIDWEFIEPNYAADWVDQRSDAFAAYTVLGNKDVDRREPTVFKTYSRGVSTGRDPWVYGFSLLALKARVQQMIQFYNEQVDFVAAGSKLDYDSREISWTRGLKADVAKHKKHAFVGDSLCVGTYRPFFRQHVYFNRALNDMVYKMPSMFPTPGSSNLGFYVVGSGSAVPFSVLMLDTLPNLHVTGAGSGGQFFPRWTFEDASGELRIESNVVDQEEGYRRLDNISDCILEEFQDKLSPDVVKDDIFYYAYGLLHSPQYRETFAADLRKMLPRIPTPQDKKTFDAFVDAGRRLADLHIGYESVEPYPLKEDIQDVAGQSERDLWRVTKMKWRSKADHSAIVYNQQVTLSGIPDGAHRYVLGSRTALDWIIDRYRVRTDKASGIVNDPNDWCDEHDDPRYIVDLIKRVTTVSVQTMAIVDALPELDL